MVLANWSMNEDKMSAFTTSYRQETITVQVTDKKLSLYTDGQQWTSEPCTTMSTKCWMLVLSDDSSTKVQYTWYNQ